MVGLAFTATVITCIYKKGAVLFSVYRGQYVAYVHVSVITPAYLRGAQYHLTFTALLLLCAPTPNVVLYVTHQQNTAGNCPLPQFSIRFVLSIISMIE